jgi:hypothetical protein
MSVPDCARSWRARWKRGLYCRGASRAKACAGTPDPKSRALETDASGLNRWLHGARASSRNFVVGCSVSAVNGVWVARKWVERHRSLQTKTPQTRLNHGAFVEQLLEIFRRHHHTLRGCLHATDDRAKELVGTPGQRGRTPIGECTCPEGPVIRKCDSAAPPVTMHFGHFGTPGRLHRFRGWV